MERRDYVLRQALEKNSDETERWLAFKADNEAAIKNLDLFSKQLTVEVMVPIGKKALMPGELVHTNELLVGHYQGYFSNCSAYKAKEICNHRLRLAEEHLKQLQVEAELWQNKLETPLLEGAVPNEEEIEIVEDFNVEEHNNWLKEHKESVKKQKEKERLQREQEQDNGVDMLQKLEEHELMEELGLDPNKFNEQELGEILKTPLTESKDCDKEVEATLTDEQVFEILNKLETQEQHEVEEIESEAEQNLQNTKDLVLNLMKDQTEVKSVKQRIGKKNKDVEEFDTGEIEDIEEDDDDDEEQQPQEVKLIRDQLALLPDEEREKFLKEQLQIIKLKMRNLHKEHFINEELIHLMNVVVCLEDDLQDIIEQMQAASTEELSDEADVQVESSVEKTDNKKRRISFALTDEQLVFRQHETVAEMMPKAKKKQQRDVIKLDAPLQQVQKAASTVEPTAPTSPQIMQKVEQNLEFVKEHQSVQDFDLVQQILEASTGAINTLHIGFKHSETEAALEDYDGYTPGNPAHFYSMYKKTLIDSQSKEEFPIYVNSFEGEQELNVSILKEEARQAAYDDPRAQFSKLNASLHDGEDMESKSILRNKSAVEREARAVSEESKPISEASAKSKKGRNKKKKQRTIDDDLREMSAYTKVMHDLVEKEPTVPEPLPEGKYIDAHTPKKRISRFKEQRSMNKT